jgi:hypothetical protein
MQPVDPDQTSEHANPDWFREPSPREHRIAAALFIGFGVFFVLLFFVLSGWWFRWVIMVLGVYSTIHGIRHALDASRTKSVRATDLETGHGR